MKRFGIILLFSVTCLQADSVFHKLKPKPAEPSSLDKYLSTLSAEETAPPEAQPGSLWTPHSHLTESSRDLRANSQGDVLTVVVSESTNAVVTGASATQRTTSANASVTSLAGPKSVTGALANLANMTGAQKLDAKGSTSRTTSLTSTLTVRVARVLPGGLLLIEGSKTLQVNSENQTVSVRGLVRTSDITSSNTVPSQSVADIEIRVNGKGIVGDSIRRPNILYRILLGLLPF